MVFLSQAEIDDELFLIPSGSFGYVEELLPGQAFVINSYIELSESYPRVAIVFMDENNDIQYYGILSNYSDDVPPYYLWRFEDRANEFTGKQVEVRFVVSSEPPDWEPEGPYLGIAPLIR